MMYTAYTQMVLKTNRVCVYVYACVCVDKDNDKTNMANYENY